MPNVPAFHADRDVPGGAERCPGRGQAGTARCGASRTIAGALAAVCHRPAVLVDLCLSDGSLLVAGKDIAGFSNDRERTIDRDTIVPFLLRKIRHRTAL
jgi:hypothetical protein